MAEYIRRKQLEKTTVTRHFAIKWSTSARVDFFLLERQTRACSYRRVKHRARPQVSSRQKFKARPDQAAIATAAEAPGTTHRARPRSPFSQGRKESTYDVN